MGWTYEEYMRQPTWFIDSILTVQSLDSEYAQKEEHFNT